MAKPMFARRLAKELKDLSINAPSGVEVIDANDFKVWRLGLAGAPNTLYEGEKFQLEVFTMEPYLEIQRQDGENHQDNGVSKKTYVHLFFSFRIRVSFFLFFINHTFFFSSSRFSLFVALLHHLVSIWTQLSIRVSRGALCGECTSPSPYLQQRTHLSRRFIQPLESCTDSVLDMSVVTIDAVQLHKQGASTRQ